MEPNRLEQELSKVACLLDELNGEPWSKHEYQGFHPKIYWSSNLKERADELVAELCSKLKNTDVSQYSLEMQMWWRDHQIADSEREKEELARKEKALQTYKKAKQELIKLGIQPD